MKNIFLIIAFFLQFLVPFHIVNAQEVRNQVDTSDGVFVGVETESGRQFLGIPYAKAPIGELRWKAPQRYPKGQSVQMAQDFGSECVQPIDGWNFNPSIGDEMKGSEDCLFLNIYTPKNAQTHKPVMVWIHGGGFVTGSGNEYDGHILAEAQDVIVVTINYRLGSLGFLSHESFGAESGNFGLLDQQMALKWVQRNISAFGGDPEKVTIFGESAGGVSVCAHLRTPSSNGLFSRAIIQSGPCLSVPKVVADTIGSQFAKNLDCPTRGSEAIQCLRKLPAFTVASNATIKTSAGITAWSVVGNTALVNDPNVFTTGDFNRVPVINGTNLDEGRLFALASLSQLKTQQDYKNNIELLFGDKASKVLSEYPVKKYSSVALAYAAYITDSLFACPAQQSSLAMSEFTPVYAYEFRDRSGHYFQDAPSQIGNLGAHHAKEIQYIFRTPSFFSGPAELTSEQRILSDQMMKEWTHFARDGVPDGSSDSGWKNVSSNDLNVHYFDIRDSNTTYEFAEAHNCTFWNAL